MAKTLQKFWEKFDSTVTLAAFPCLNFQSGVKVNFSSVMSGSDSNMNIPRNVFSPTVSNKTERAFEWTDRPGENLISDSEWLAVKNYARLSMREGQVCRLLFEGNKRDEIAEMLGISPRTVRYHLESLHKKLKVNTRVGLVLRMVQLRDFLVGKNQNQNQNQHVPAPTSLHQSPFRVTS